MKPIIYTSDDYNAPQLKNEYGSMVKLLKTLLVDGLPTLDIKLTPIDKVSANITLSDTNAFLQIESVVYITIGSTDYRFHVKSKDDTTYVIKNYDDVDLTSIGSTVDLKLKRPSLGYKLKFDDIANTGKAVFENNDEWLLRVHDELPTENDIWSKEWAKSARVSFGKGMVDIDTWETQPSNYDNTLPDGWKAPYRLTSNNSTNWSTTKISRNFWTYMSYYSYLASDNNPLSGFGNVTSPYTLIGNNDCFYLVVKPLKPYYTACSFTYAFGKFDTFIQGDSYNYFLLANSNTSENTMYNYIEWRSNYYAMYGGVPDNSDMNAFYNGGNGKCFCLARNYKQQYETNGQYGGVKWFSSNGGYSGGSNNFDLLDKDLMNVLYNNILVTENNNNLLRGKLKFTNAIITNMSNYYSTQSAKNYVLANTNDGDKMYHILPSATYSDSSNSVMFDLYNE